MPSLPAEVKAPLSFEHALAPVERILIYSHMNPDPDTVGAALGIQQLIRDVYGKTVQACYRGIVGRAENRQLLRLIGGGLVHAREIDQSQFQAALLVDSQPDYGYIKDLDRLPILGIIDHHPVSGESSGIPYRDIRPDYGSTSTIVTEYLREAGLEPRSDVATALFYGLKTDTLDLTRRTGPPDISAYNWLFPRIDRRTLSRIENPPLSKAYYAEFVTAVGRAIIYRRAVLTEIGRMAYPDMVAEIADRLIRLDEMEWSVCFGQHEQRLYLSVRTSHPTKDAGILVKAVLRNDGVGGGHDTMAAGRVQLPEGKETAYMETVDLLWRRFLDELGEDPERGERMVPNHALAQRLPLAGKG